MMRADKLLLTERITRHLRHGGSFTNAEIAVALDVRPNSTAEALGRLVARREIEFVGDHKRRTYKIAR